MAAFTGFSLFYGPLTILAWDVEKNYGSLDS